MFSTFTDDSDAGHSHRHVYHEGELNILTDWVDYGDDCHRDPNPYHYGLEPTREFRYDREQAGYVLVWSLERDGRLK